MEHTTLDFVIANLDAVKGTWRAVAEASGVPFGTVRKIGTRETKNPRIDTVEQLAKHFRENPPRVVQILQAQPVDSAA
jgi:hypothetical protein